MIPPTSLRSLYLLSKSFRSAFIHAGQANLPHVLNNNSYLLQEYYRSGAQDWRKYKFESRAGYSKSWIDMLPDEHKFGLAILTWLPGQETDIHGHPKYGCLLMPLEGVLRESRFFNDGKVVQADYGPGMVSYIDNKLGVHRIRNIGPNTAVSLHVYSPKEY